MGELALAFEPLHRGLLVWVRRHGESTQHKCSTVTLSLNSVKKIPKFDHTNDISLK